jgi:hypothetical protein
VYGGGFGQWFGAGFVVDRGAIVVCSSWLLQDTPNALSRPLFCGGPFGPFPRLNFGASVAERWVRRLSHVRCGTSEPLRAAA